MSYTNLAREYLFLFVELCNYTDVNITLDGLSYYISLVEIMSFFREENVRSVLNIQLKEAVTEPVTCTSLCLCARLLQSHLTLHNSIDCSLSGSSVCGIFQARILEWVPMPPLGDLPNPGVESASPALQTDSLLARHWGSPVHHCSPIRCHCLVPAV